MNEKFLRNSAIFVTALTRAIEDPSYTTRPVPNLPNPFTVGGDIASTMRANAASGVASTGTPISHLRGIAWNNAVDTVLGGGPKSAGGGGIEGGRLSLARASRSATSLTVAGWGIDVAARVAVPCAIATAEVIRANRAEKKAQRVQGEEK